MIIVIDGPAGAGKSSTAKAIARKTGINYVDSGAMYRGFTALYIHNDKDKKKFFDQIDQNPLQFSFDEDNAQVFLNDENITEYIRSDEVNEHVSEVAALPEIRAKVLQLLKTTVADTNSDYIAEGRDLGTVVFPDADLKFFLTADLDVRASRRLAEMDKQADQNKLHAVKKNLESRDKKDSSRKEAPLIKADDAIEIDTSGLRFDEQIQVIIEKITNLKDGKVPSG